MSDRTAWPDERLTAVLEPGGRVDERLHDQERRIAICEAGMQKIIDRQSALLVSVIVALLTVLAGAAFTIAQIAGGS